MVSESKQQGSMFALAFDLRCRQASHALTRAVFGRSTVSLRRLPTGAGASERSGGGG
jgi:hypothetical protein